MVRSALLSWVSSMWILASCWSRTRIRNSNHHRVLGLTACWVFAKVPTIMQMQRIIPNASHGISPRWRAHLSPRIFSWVSSSRASSGGTAIFCPLATFYLSALCWIKGRLRILLWKASSCPRFWKIICVKVNLGNSQNSSGCLFIVEVAHH